MQQWEELHAAYTWEMCRNAYVITPIIWIQINYEFYLFFNLDIFITKQHGILKYHKPFCASMTPVYMCQLAQINPWLGNS